MSSQPECRSDPYEILREIPELGFVTISGAGVAYIRPRCNVLSSRARPVLRYLGDYSVARGFRGDYFLCLYDGWREYSRPHHAPEFRPWHELDKSGYQGYGSQGEPRFCHLLGDNIFPVLPLPILTFCRHKGDPNAFLLPDPEFLMDRFLGFTNQVDRKDLPWELKQSASLYWRGSKRPVREFREPSPREHAVNSKLPHIDASYDPTPVSEALRHKFLLDLDGMVSAWSGLFWKLRSNSLPVKMRSHWEQWYYYLLRDWHNLVYTDEDLSATYLSLLDDDDAARSTAERGRQLTHELTYEFAVEEYSIAAAHTRDLS